MRDLWNRHVFGLQSKIEGAMDDGSGDYKDDETACVIRYENEG